jgi:WS/DGAT/MGAT family acyltransferase
VIEQRFLAYARFRQKPVDGATGAQWVEDADFDLDWHVRLSGLPGKNNPAAEKKALERFVSQLASSPLDPTKPLWQFHLIERYQGGSAIVARIHHCYADGIALVQVLLSLTDTSRESSQASRLDKAWLKQDAAPVARRVGAVDKYMKLGGKVLEQGMAMYRDPTLAGLIAKEGGELARELVTALALPDDPPSLLRGRLGVSKRVAWAEPLDLEEVKAVGRACDCTVNDVLMAAAAGALRGYMLDRGEHLEGMTLRATVPVNLRPLEHAKKLGNHFGLVFLELPVGEEQPDCVAWSVAECMNQLKNSRQAIVAYGLLAALGMAPRRCRNSRWRCSAARPVRWRPMSRARSSRCTWPACKMRDMMFWVPQTGSIGLGMSILSYNGQVHFGLIDRCR